MALDFSPPFNSETLKRNLEDKAPPYHLLGLFCSELLTCRVLYVT